MPGPDAPADRARPRPTGATYLHRELREAILALRLPPGEELDDAAIARRFDCSRATAREALLNLSADRLVELLPNRRARVTPIDFLELPRFIEAIDFVSRGINWYAAERRTDTQADEIRRAGEYFDTLVATGNSSELTAANRVFHLLVAEAADNRYLHDLYRRLHDEGMRIMHLALGPMRSDTAHQRQHLDRVCEDHRRLVAAIQAHDRDTAEAVARSHTELFRERVFAYLQLDAGDAIPVQPDSRL